MRDNSVRIGVLDEKAIATQATQATGQTLRNIHSNLACPFATLFSIFVQI